MIVNLELMVALIYLLKSSFCLTLLYGFYKLFFASTTRFSLNRWVLVGGIMGHRTKRILRIERKEYQTY